MPRLSPKSPGEVQVPTSTWFTQTETSDGQLALVPGTSDESSRLNSSASISALRTLALFGNLYSTWPRSNQISPAFMRSGSRKKSGTSRRPMIDSVEHNPHGGDTLQPV